MMQHGSTWNESDARSNRTWDFENTSSKYIELFGEHLACLTADVPHGVVQATFDKGRQDLKIKHEKTFIGKGHMAKDVSGGCGPIGVPTSPSSPCREKCARGLKLRCLY